jgi:hypothetical protein
MSIGHDTEEGRRHRATRLRAVEYVARGKAGYEQIFTTPSCKIQETDEQINVQIWVAIRKKTTEEGVIWEGERSRAHR